MKKTKPITRLGVFIIEHYDGKATLLAETVLKHDKITSKSYHSLISKWVRGEQKPKGGSIKFEMLRKYMETFHNEQLDTTWLEPIAPAAEETGKNTYAPAAEETGENTYAPACEAPELQLTERSELDTAANYIRNMKTATDNFFREMGMFMNRLRERYQNI